MPPARTHAAALKPHFTPATILALIGSAIAVAVAFGAPLSQHQTDSILTLASAVAILSFTHGLTGFLNGLNKVIIAGLVSAVIGVAVAFGVDISPKETDSILTLVGILSTALLGVGGAAHVVQTHHAAKAHAAQLEPPS